MSKRVHLKGLNGLRAIAALSVVLYHTFTHMDWFGLDQYVIWGKLENNKPHSFLMGAFAVTIFFTLSGFLITYLLLREQQIKEIDIGNFYIRRILRIWPLYFLFIPIKLGLYEFLDIPYLRSSIIYYLLFTANIAFYLKVSIELLGNYWTLCVEEQFYLVWPVFIKFSKSKYLRNTIILLSVLIILRGMLGFLKFYNPAFTAYNDFMGQSRYHTMIIGALAAMLFLNNNEIFIKIFTNKYVVLTAWGIIFLPIIKGFKIAGFHEITALGTVAIIISQISSKNRWINLENKILDFLGKISFGIYMTHGLVLFCLSHFVIQFETLNVWNYVVVIILVMSITILVSTLSYYYFEKWFLNLKKKYTTIEAEASANPD